MERRKVKFAWKPIMLDNGEEVIFERYISIQEPVGDKFFDRWHEVRVEEYTPPRFQECSKLVQLWRYRYYIPIPFLWFWRKYVSTLFVMDDETLEREPLSGILLWHILIGSAQIKMRWFYTMDEMNETLDELKLKLKNQKSDDTLNQK